MTNEVTNFMYYMYNRWCIEESKMLFGENLGQHVFDKWVGKGEHTNDQTMSWYGELDTGLQNKLVARANELYSN